MTKNWRFIDSGDCDAYLNMAIDEAIAISVREKKSPPTLRIYGWKNPSVSLGAFQKISDVNVRYCMLNKIAIVRRPTGGRGILHDNELTYSFSCVNEGPFAKSLLDTYKILSDIFINAFKKVGLNAESKRTRLHGRDLIRDPLCFNSTSYGEIVFDEKKIIGSAQKRWDKGFLQQGSIPFLINYKMLKMVFAVNTEKFNFIGLKEVLPDLSKDEFKRKIKESFEEGFSISFIESPLFSFERKLAQSLLYEKYQNVRWTEIR
jgi:lipoate-protein ligase A